MNTSAHLQKLRNDVQLIDRSIIKLLGKRFKATEQIQSIKRQLKMPINQKKREKELLEKYIKAAIKLNIPTPVINKLFKVVFSYSKKSGIIS